MQEESKKNKISESKYLQDSMKLEHKVGTRPTNHTKPRNRSKLKEIIPAHNWT